MSLLEQASLVMIPSGYKEDVVYCPKPTDGSGDLTFTRASDGTRVNSQGLVERVPWNFLEQSSNLGSWSNAGVTITTSITDAYGTTNAITMSNISSGNITDYIVKYYNAMALPTGTQINYSVYLKGSGTIGVAIERSLTGDYFIDTQIIALTNTWTRYDFAYTIPVGVNANGIGFYVTNLTGTTATSVDICFPQINYGSTAKPYFPTTDRLNVPRLTYQNGGGGCPSLLLEPQRTNLITYSENFDQAYWPHYTTGAGSVTKILNNAISPDGTQNADEIQLTRTALTDDALTYQQQGVGSATYSRTIYLKAARSQDVGKKIQIWSYDGSSVKNVYEPVLTADWVRFDAGTSTGALVEILSFGYLSSYTYPSTSGLDVRFYAWGAQGEAGSYPTSYIPTTSAAVTRVADAAYKTGISSLIGQTEGSVFLDFTVSNLSETNNEKVLWYMRGGGTGERFVTLLNIGQLSYIENNGSTIATISKTGLTVGRHKCAIAYATNDFVFYVDGVQIGTDTSGTPSGFSEFGLQYFVSAYAGSQNVNQAVLFKTRLTNTELAALTTL